jgi:hypothetical protein
MMPIAPLLAVLLCVSLAFAADHPVLNHGINESKRAEYESLVAPAMAMSEAQWLSFVPTRNPSRHCECPNCYGGVEGNHIFKWSINEPDQMTCRFCEMVWPDERYVEDKTLTGQNALGETITFPYYYGEEMDAPHFLSDNLAAWRSNWQLQVCEALGKMYQLTGDEAYVRRVALVLDRMAALYPHYPVMQQLPRVFRFREKQEPPFDWDSGKWGWFHNEVPKSFVKAYDLTFDSDVYEQLSADRGYDVRQRIVNDLFRPTAEAAIQSPYHMSNIIGYDVAGVSQMGQVIGEPRYVHWAYGKMRDVAEKGFYYDGLWHESPSYHYMTIGGLRSAFSVVRGYSDPPGYIDEVDGTRFDNFNPDADLPFLSRAKDAPAIIGYPDGISATVHDTHANEKRSPPTERTTSALAPGFGHAVLGRGEGDHQMQAHLHFSGGGGHGHYDNLNLILWAKGREMLPDVGYTWTQMRYWTAQTLAHNTVVIDRASQTLRDSDGNLLMFYPDTAGVAVVEADGKRAYAQTRDGGVYRRTLVTVPISDQDAYVVDIFRVQGGTTHDWTLHGDADHDTTATCSVPLSGHLENLMIEGEVWEEPTKQYSTYPVYGLIRDVRTGQIDGSMAVTFDYEDDRALRVHVLSDKAQVLLGRSPSVRRMGYGANGDMRKAYDFWMPHLIVRREASGDEPLSSVYAAVHEPYVSEPLIDRVERVAVSPNDGSAVAIRVVHGGVEDTIITTTDQTPYPWRQTADGMKLRGRVAVVRKVAGRTQAAWLFDGAALGSGDRTIEQRQRLEGKVLGALRVDGGDEHDALIVEGQLPTGDALRGRWMIVTHGDGLTHGYEIVEVRRHARGSLVIVTYDHGLAIDGDTTREIYYPKRTFTGGNTFTIPLDATWPR